MKKLVTIVSAVMMLLMLAACAPSVSLDADTAATLEDGQTAISQLVSFAYANKDEDGNATADNDTVINTSYTVVKGATTSISLPADMTKDFELSVSVNGTVKWGEGTNAKEVAVEYSYTAAVSVTKGGTTEQPTYAYSFDNYSVDTLSINGENYDPYAFAAVNGGTAIVAPSFGY